MKILILNAIKEWICSAFDIEKWKNIAEQVGLGIDQFHQKDHVFSDDRFANLLNAMSKTLEIEKYEMNNTFIEYWMTEFAPKVYRFYIKKSNSAKEFILGILKLNNNICNLLPNKYISKIDFNEINRNTVSVIYPSEKSLVDLVAVLRGINVFFSDKFSIKKINPHSVEIKFEKAAEN